MSGLDLTRLEIGDMRPDERGEAIAVVARAMSDSPMTRAVVGEDRQRCLRHLERLFTAIYLIARDQRPLVARLDGRVVASTNDLVSGACRFSFAEKLRTAPRLLPARPGVAIRALRWLSDWEGRDPNSPHSHYGPFGVEPGLQGRGIGSGVLADYTRRLDAAGEDAYLETDKPENVALYSRFGFEVIDEAEVIGVRNWFMWRPAGAGAPATQPAVSAYSTRRSASTGIVRASPTRSS